jgi:hypothetical protein
VETFTAPRDLVNNAKYHQQRLDSLHKLDLAAIDSPLIDLIRDFSQLQYCFTLQCCFGHFLYAGNEDLHNMEPLPLVENVEIVEYRIAYLSVCLEESIPGKDLFLNLAEIPSADPDYIQFGSADWFWERQLNSYILQVEPVRHRYLDKCQIDYREALHIEKIRNQLFKQLATLIGKRLGNKFERSFVEV